MGREVFLFNITSNGKMLADDFKIFLSDNGFLFVKNEEFSNYQSLYYEKNTENGIIELSIKIEKENVLGFYCRFSLLNPKSVIDITFDFFYNLLNKFTVSIVSSEEEILFDNKTELKLRVIILEKMKLFNKNFLDINKPIRGGSETYDYLSSLKK